MDKLEFNLSLKEMPVEIVDTTGAKKQYILKELSGQARDTFLTDMAKRCNFGPSGRVQNIKNFQGLQAGLLSLCLYDEQSVLIKKDVLQTFPSSVLSGLFEAAQTLSSLETGGSGTEKND